VVYKGHLS